MEKTQHWIDIGLEHIRCLLKGRAERSTNGWNKFIAQKEASCLAPHRKGWKVEIQEIVFRPRTEPHEGLMCLPFHDHIINRYLISSQIALDYINCFTNSLTWQKEIECRAETDDIDLYRFSLSCFSKQMNDEFTTTFIRFRASFPLTSVTNFIIVRVIQAGLKRNLFELFGLFFNTLIPRMNIK